MTKRIALTACAVLLGSVPAWAQRTPDGHPDFQGFWTNGTATPFHRPAEFSEKVTFTAGEAAEFERTALDRLVKSVPADDRDAADLNDTYLETQTLKVVDLRTSLIVDPADGKLPPLLPVAQARNAA